MRSIDMPFNFDQSVYNGRGLIEVISCNLADRSDEAGLAQMPGSLREKRVESWLSWKRDGENCANPQGQLSHVVFAHNDIPLESVWADPTRRGAVFREEPGNPWRNRPFGNYSYVPGAATGFKFRNGSPPRWAQRLRLKPSDGNATVLRLDDVGNHNSYHGYHLVTLFEDGTRKIEWKPLPR